MKLLGSLDRKEKSDWTLITNTELLISYILLKTTGHVLKLG